MRGGEKKAMITQIGKRQFYENTLLSFWGGGSVIGGEVNSPGPFTLGACNWSSASLGEVHRFPRAPEKEAPVPSVMRHF